MLFLISLKDSIDRINRTIEGNGLGLSIVKRIIDLHHYKIDVESQEDVGSVFTVYIPYEMFTGLTKKKKD